MRDLSAREAGALLTLGLLLGSTGCSVRDGAPDGDAPDTVSVSFLPGPPTTKAGAASRTGPPVPAVGATPQAGAGALRRAKQALGTAPYAPPSAAAGRTAPLLRTSAASSVPAVGGSVFLPLGSCAATDPGAGAGAYRQVGCDTSAAVATVIRRYPAGATASCPEATDFALRLSTVPDDGSAARPSGVACLRNRHSPHPGDPGGGGGVGILPGDCLYRAGGASVRETACDGSGPHAPRYRVNSLVAAQGDCPDGTGAYIAVHNPGAAPQIACATVLRTG